MATLEGIRGIRGRLKAPPAPAATLKVEGLSRWFALAAFALVLWVSREVLAPFVVGVVLAYILSPLADEISQRSRLSQRWSGLLVFGIFATIIALAIWLATGRAMPSFRAASRDIVGTIESAAAQLTGGAGVEFFGRTFTPRELAERIYEALNEQVGSPGDALHALESALSLTLSTLVALLTMAYLLVDGHHVQRFLLRFVPADHRDDVEIVAAEIHRVLGRYLQGQMLLIVIVSVFTYAALELIFGLPHALPIAIATGFLELVPLLGPFIAAAVACAVALAQGGPPEAGAVALLYLAIRQLEDQLVMPLVVGRAVHVHPLVTIFAVVAGEHLAGVLGALLAVPLAAAAKVVLDYAYPASKVSEP